MTHEQAQFQINAQKVASKKGWFWLFLLQKVLPLIIDNWDDIFQKKASLDSDKGVTPPPPITDPEP